jgi:hypothetical protein
MAYARRCGRLCVAIAAAGALIACSDQPASPTAQTPVDANAPRVGTTFGTPVIEYVSANYAPGSTIDGCGTTVAGCTRKLSLRFRLRTLTGGAVERADTRLHGNGKIACLYSITPSFSFPPGAMPEFDVLFDQADSKCTLPLDVTDLDMNIFGSAPINARQEWGIRYRFLP